MAVTFNHTGITVRDLDRTEALLRDLFGFETISRAPRAPELIAAVIGVEGAEVEVVYMQNGATRLELLAYSAPADRADYRPRPCDLGSLHIAVNVDDFDAALARAKAWPLDQVGAPVQIDAGPNEGLRIVYVRTPDEGLIIEMIEARGD